jgi:RNA polymerase sigma-70 factor (ECF subfamily)
MARVSHGDAQAFRELSEIYLKRVLNHTNRILGNVAEAEEVTQEAFLKLWQIAPSWKPQVRVGAWLFKVAHNASIDRFRARRVQIDDHEVPGADSVGPARVLDRRRAADAVREAIARLPDRQRHALQLSHYDGLSNPEIAEVLAVGVEAVESLLARARRTLREKLTEHRGAEHE